MADIMMNATPAGIDGMTRCWCHLHVGTNNLPAHLRQIISNLYILLVQTHDHHGSSTSTAMTSEIKSLLQNLFRLTETSRQLPTKIPLDLIEYVERKRNPDVYKREIVEDVMKSNQVQKGRAEAYGAFRDMLGREMMSAIPDIKDEVKDVLEACGGSADG
jgi:mediator of RNA polymerase II transcription subunit 10